MSSVNTNSLSASLNTSAMGLNQPSEIPGIPLFHMCDTNCGCSLGAPFMQFRHYWKPFVQLPVCYLMLAIHPPVSLGEYIQPPIMSLTWGSCFFGKVLFKERPTYESSGNNMEFVFCLQPSIQWVLRWCKWPHSGTVQEDQWFSKCLLGMGWRRWWSLEQVSFECLGLSVPSNLWDQLGAFCSVTCYIFVICFKWTNSTEFASEISEYTIWRNKYDVLFPWPGDS